MIYKIKIIYMIVGILLIDVGIIAIIISSSNPTQNIYDGCIASFISGLLCL